MNKQWRHVQLWLLGLKQGVSIQDAEGVLVLVDSVGVRQGLVFTLSVGAGAWMHLILHHQICVTLCHDAAARHIFYTGNNKLVVIISLDESHTLVSLH